MMSFIGFLVFFLIGVYLYQQSNSSCLEIFEKFNNIEEKIDQITYSVDGVIESIAQIDSEIETVKEGIDQIKDEIETIKEGIDQTQSEIETMAV